jgi:hypothetical protein
VPSLNSAFSDDTLEVSHRRIIYTVEIAKYYQSVLSKEPVVSHLAAHRWCHCSFVGRCILLGCSSLLQNGLPNITQGL